MWANPANLPSFVGTTDIPSTQLPKGKLIIAGIFNKRMLITVTWAPPGTDPGQPHQFVTSASIDANL
jgi:hypothetical protein